MSSSKSMKIRRPWWRISASAALGIAALSGALILLSPNTRGLNSARASSPAASVPPTVMVARVSANSPSTRTARFAGVLTAQQHAELAFPLPGRIEARNVELGERVDKGQVLAALDRASLRSAQAAASAAVQRAKAQLAHGRRIERRMKRLSKVDAATTVDLEDAEHRATVADASALEARSALAQARKALADATLRAPFSGLITRVDVEVGEHVGPGEVVVELVDDRSLELEVEVPETWLPRLSIGDVVRVDLPLAAMQTDGIVRSVGQASRGDGLFPVVVRLSSETLKAGMTAELVLVEPPPPGLSVPVEAVVDRSGNAPRVYVVEQARVREVEVKVAALLGAHAIVDGPLSPEATVVTRGHIGLVDGELVEVLP